MGILSLSVLLGDVLSATLSGVGRIDLANYTQVGAQALAGCGKSLSTSQMAVTDLP